MNASGLRCKFYQSVAILTPVLVFLGPFVAFSFAMQWDFATKESFNIFYGFFFGGLIWFLVCVAACLCTAMPRNSASEVHSLEKSRWRYAKRCLQFVSMFFLISICLMLTHRYDYMEKKERYESVHKKFCELDLSQPLHRLMETHQHYSQREKQQLAANVVKDAYMDSLNTLSAWMDATSWETTVVMTDRDSLSLISSGTNFLPIPRKLVSDYPGLAMLSVPFGVSFCEIVHVGGRWKSLRTTSYEGQAPTAILTKVREERNRY